jgi:hypothetical protein
VKPRERDRFHLSRAAGEVANPGELFRRDEPELVVLPADFGKLPHVGGEAIDDLPARYGRVEQHGDGDGRR